VAGVLHISKKDAARNYRFLVYQLKQNVPKVDPQDYISRIVNKLRLSGNTERVAKSILHQATLLRLTGGRGPAGIAAACVYIATRITGDSSTQGDIARVVQVTEVTIRNRYKELFDCLELSVKV
jgi:transcription initiation factor TFIIB